MKADAFLFRSETTPDPLYFEKMSVGCEKKLRRIVFYKKGGPYSKVEKKRKEEALKHAMESYLSLLLHIAYSYMGNRAEAEDIVQEVFLAYYQKAPQFASGEHEKAWLLRTTGNKCKNVLKSGWFKRTILGEAQMQYHKEMRSEVMEAVLRLPVKYREVICLYYVEGYSIKEIAELLHRTPTAVGTQLERARKKLKMELEEA